MQGVNPTPENLESFGKTHRKPLHLSNIVTWYNCLQLFQGVGIFFNFERKTVRQMLDSGFLGVIYKLIN